MKLNPQHVVWQKQLLDALNINGVWAIPRSLTQVTKVSATQVKIQGESDEPLLRAHIEAAGYSVVWEPLPVPDGQHRHEQ